MDLEPFTRINPCGYAGLRVTQLQDLGIKAGLADIAERLSAILVKDLGYTHCQAADSLPPLPYLETRHA
jgi:lipoyl(octanoyl) transferase